MQMISFSHKLSHSSGGKTYTGKPIDDDRHVETRGLNENHEKYK